MSNGNRIKETTTATNTATITLGGAPSGFRTFANGLPAGSSAIEVMVGPDSNGSWLIGSYTLTNSNTLTRNAILDSSNGGADVVLAAGAKDVYNTISGATLASFSGPRDVAFSTTVPLSQLGGAYMAQKTVTAPLTFSSSANPVRGAMAYLRLIADGVNVPVFSGFKVLGGSFPYLNIANAVNILQFFFDGVDSWVYITQPASALEASPTVPDAPTIGTAQAGDGYVDIYFTRNSNGGSSVLDSTATLSNGNSATGTTSPIRVTTPNSTAVTATVRDRNSYGLSAPSAASNSVTPTAGAAAPVQYLRYGSLVRAAESGTGPYTYTASGAGTGFGTTEGSGVLTKAFQPGIDGELIVKSLSTPSGGSNEVFFAADSSGATGRKYAEFMYGIVGHAATYDNFSYGYRLSETTAFGGASGDYIRYRRTGSTLDISVSKDNGATYTSVANYTNVPTGVLYLHTLVTGTGSWTPVSSTGLA